jgi:hypothetical protein
MIIGGDKHAQCSLVTSALGWLTPEGAGGNIIYDRPNYLLKGKLVRVGACHHGDYIRDVTRVTVSSITSHEGRKSNIAFHPECAMASFMLEILN